MKVDAQSVINWTVVGQLIDYNSGGRPGVYRSVYSTRVVARVYPRQLIYLSFNLQDPLPSPSFVRVCK